MGLEGCERGMAWGGKWFVMLTCMVAACLVMEVGGGPLPVSSTVPFTENYFTTADATHAKILNNGQQVQLVLDIYSASSFSSKNFYLFGNIGMGIKLVPGNSSGTVTAYYLSSPGPTRDELDFEFLGNISGQPYTVQTNVYAKGVGGREQRVNLWFDPSTSFHTYSVLWNKYQVIFFVDTTPIRVYRNSEDLGVPYPNSQGVGIYTSIWDGSNWATHDGWIKLNWTDAPFVATFEGFGMDACQVVNNDPTSCASATNNWWDQSEYQTLTPNQINELKVVQRDYLIYDYCTDTKRNPTPPPECARNWF